MDDSEVPMTSVAGTLHHSRAFGVRYKCCRVDLLTLLVEREKGDSCMILWYYLYYLHIYRVICDEDITATPIDSSVVMGLGGGAVD